MFCLQQEQPLNTSKQPHTALLSRRSRQRRFMGKSFKDLHGVYGRTIPFCGLFPFKCKSIIFADRIRFQPVTVTVTNADLQDHYASLLDLISVCLPKYATTAPRVYATFTTCIAHPCVSLKTSYPYKTAFGINFIACLTPRSPSTSSAPPCFCQQWKVKGAGERRNVPGWRQTCRCG